MSNGVLVLGNVWARIDLIGMSVREQTHFVPIDGSQLVNRQDPPKNWFAAGQYVLLIVDLAHLGGSATQLMMLEDYCATIDLPILVITDKEDPPHVVFGEGGPYLSGQSLNPPWRIVCRPADRDQALQKFKAWKASQ